MDKEHLLLKRKLAIYALEDLRRLCKEAAEITGESDMTADYIWGNCTIEELEAILSAPKTAILPQ